MRVNWSVLSCRQRVWVGRTARGDRRVCNGGAQKGLRAEVSAVGCRGSGQDGGVVITEAAREEGLHSMVGYVREGVRVDMGSEDGQQQQARVAASFNAGAQRSQQRKSGSVGRAAQVHPDLISSHPPASASADMHAYLSPQPHFTSSITAHLLTSSFCLDTVTALC